VAKAALDAPGDGLIDAFADALWLEEGLSPNTLQAYRRDLLQLHRFLPGQALIACTELQLQQFFAARHEVTKASTANRRLTVFKRFFRWALRQNLVHVDPTLKLQTAKQALRVPKTLSEAQVEALLAAPDVQTALGVRDRAMLELLYASGLRVSELVGLQVFALGLNDNVVRVMGKGSKERLVPYGEVASQWLRAYLGEARSTLLAGRQTDALFVTTKGAQAGGAMSRVMFWMRIKNTRRWPASLRRCHRTPCAMRLPRICSTMVPICAPCSCC